MFQNRKNGLLAWKLNRNPIFLIPCLFALTDVWLRAEKLTVNFAPSSSLFHAAH